MEGNCPDQTTIFRCYKQFKRVKFSPNCDPRRDRPAESVTPENIAAARVDTLYIILIKIKLNFNIV